MHQVFQVFQVHQVEGLVRCVHQVKEGCELSTGGEDRIVRSSIQCKLQPAPGIICFLPTPTLSCLPPMPIMSNRFPFFAQAQFREHSLDKLVSANPHNAVKC